jgi:hypothetical protein
MTPEQYYRQQFPSQLVELITRHSHAHGEDAYLSTRDLTAEAFSHVPPSERGFFCIFLALTVALDELMYTHFRKDYEAFKSVARYPKVELGITGIHLNPWSILRLSPPSATVGTFRDCCSFFLRECRDFFQKQHYAEASWEHVLNTMETDPDLQRGLQGKVFVEEARKLRGCLDTEQTTPNSSSVPQDEKYLREVMGCSDQEIAELTEAQRKRKEGK